MLTLVQKPQSPVVTLDEIKRYLRVDTSDSDILLIVLINAATSYFDGPTGILGQALSPQTWKFYLADWSEQIEIPFGPVIAVTSITYLDTSGVEQTLATSEYDVGDDGTTVTLSPTGSWPSLYSGREDAVRVTFDAGYQNLESPENYAIPQAVALAIMATVAHFYDNGVGDIPEQIQTLVAPFKRGRLG